MNTKKDYQRAAKIVAGMNQDGFGGDKTVKAATAWTVREAFVVFFSGDNPQFDATRFREVCASSNG